MQNLFTDICNAALLACTGAKDESELLPLPEDSRYGRRVRRDNDDIAETHEGPTNSCPCRKFTRAISIIGKFFWFFSA